LTTAPQTGPATAPLAFDEAAFAAALAPVLSRLLGGDGRVEVVDRVSGNINLVLKFAYRGRPLGARVALNAQRFRYEKGIVKEVFAVLLLAYGSGRLDDSRLRQIVDAVLHRPTGSHVNHHWVRPILWYDWSLAALPYPFFVFEWVEGEPLWTKPAAGLYERAGAELAGLHRLAFEHFYEDIFAIDRSRLEWSERFRAAWARELAEAAPALPAAAAAALAAFDTAGIDAGRPCLVHNDYTGGNLLVEPAGGLRLIDWDNWVVDCAELDLVKMKYWTNVGADGLLAHQPDLYGAFRRGYDRAAEQPVDESRLAAYERLWLMRTFNFERTRGDGEAVSWQAVYPRADTYRRLLADNRETI
jgi:hypothetical protein